MGYSNDGGLASRLVNRPKKQQPDTLYIKTFVIFAVIDQNKIHSTREYISSDQPINIINYDNLTITAYAPFTFDYFVPNIFDFYMFYN